ncbi:hypothetical protein QJS10_CPA02g01478 [Acorus calamus]|uniref:Uncharacterized protein n=1 Tax=Acorus calamus TaxID=4465 RepID=A0AAV9FEJ0_ACOCL|nr:hypothetical protein QJS10_CPA02g01478 [Acorus calamus]
MIISIFDPMMKNLDMPGDDDGSENPSWDVKLVMDFKAQQKGIISSVLQSCYGGLQLLDGIESSNASEVIEDVNCNDIDYNPEDKLIINC